MCRTLLLLVTVVASSLALTQLEPEPEDDYVVRYTRGRDKGMVKTLHMLQELDDFYSKLSRPRLDRTALNHQPSMLIFTIHLLLFEPLRI